MSKSGLFAHFGSKEEVQLGLLEGAMKVAAASFVEPALRKPPGLPRLKAVFNGWLGWTAKAGIAGGCPVAAGMFEFDDAAADNPVRRQLSVLDQQWRELLMKLTHEAMRTGQLRSDLDAEQFVWELCGIYLAHHVSFRFAKDPRADKRAQNAFEALLARSKTVRAHPGSKPVIKKAGKKELPS